MEVAQHQEPAVVILVGLETIVLMVRYNIGIGDSLRIIAIASISSGVPLVNQHVDNKQWQYYTLSITTGGNGLLIAVNQTNGGDVDLYILQGDFPTRVKYLQREVSILNNTFIALS
jgi:hypothetical protein